MPQAAGEEFLARAFIFYFFKSFRVLGSLLIFSSLSASISVQAESDEGPVLPPTLPTLLESAMMSNPLVDAGRADLRAANLRIKTARWQYFPTPAVNFQRAFADDTDRAFQGDISSTVVSLEQPLWTGGRLSGGMAAARAGVGLSAASLEENQRDLALQVVQAYGDWLSASMQKRALSDSQSRHKVLFDRVQRRFDTGVSTGSDLELANGRLQSVRADRAATIAREYSAISKLVELTGLDLTSALLGSAPRRLPPVLKLDAIELTDNALINSARIKRADAEVRAARADIKSRRARTRPDVFLRFERQFNDLQFPGQGPESRMLVGVRTQLGAGLSSFSDIAEAREAITSALAFRRSAERIIRKEIRSDLALLESLDIRQPALKVAAITATEVYASYQRQFLSGRKSWLDVMNAARDLQQSQLQLADVTAGELTLAWRLYVLSNPLPEGV